MYVKTVTWTVQKLASLRTKIDPKPQYQRGSVWKLADKQLLIDSIIRRYDIPKIYLRKIDTGAYQYEVADGQQRLRAIWEFLADEYPLAPNCLVAGCAERVFSALPTSCVKRIRAYTLVTAIAHAASGSEIREQFIRLQRGMRLSQPEIRNAITSQLGDTIRGIASTNAFFDNSRFSRERYQADDLVAHAFLLELSEGQEDLKAPNLRAMYRDYANGVDNAICQRVLDVLKIMEVMQSVRPMCISRKWGFVDVYWVISQNAKGKGLDAEALADRYVTFEERRLSFVSHSDDLLTAHPSKADRDLYKYIQAFKTTGGLSRNVSERHRVLTSVLLGA